MHSSVVDPRAARVHQVTTALRSWLARSMLRRGWGPVVLPHPGYGGQGRVRVLARVLMAPPGRDPAAQRGLPGWRRLLTLELADVAVDVDVAGRRVTARTDHSGLLDTTLEAAPEPGRRVASLTVGDRESQATVHVASDEARFGVVCDIDDTVWITGLTSPLRAAWRTFARSGAARHPVPGMAGLLTGLVARHPGAPVVYLSNGPWNLAGPVERFLHRHGFPPGALLMTDWGVTPTAWFRDGKAHKSSALQRLSDDFPGVRWALVGDDGEHDPELYADFALRRPDRVVAIALRQVAPATSDPRDEAGAGTSEVPVVRAPDGYELLRRLRSVRTLPAPLEPGPADWLLTEAERGNDATRLRPWTTGNAVRSLVHGRSYFPVLAEALAGAAEGDLVLFADWRGDPDELLTDDGPTVAEALSSAARRGALVKGLVWRSHWDWLRFSAEQNRNLTQDVNDSGGEVLLDQRVRPFGSHHQKFLVVRSSRDPSRDVAFLGGIDLGHGRRDDAEHGGDPQTQPFADGYGGSPAWHDVQVELRGPAVRDVEDVFRERWEDPAALSRLPWQAVPDLLRRSVRAPTDLPDPQPDPPAAGSCTVQLLRTYPNRWPGYPFAPDGERSAARAYAKAVRRARRLVYVEDQYLWSTDVARVFADALRAVPSLHLVAVVPRLPDQDGLVSVPAVLLGHAQALQLVREAGGDRVQVLDVENRHGEPVYVHAKVCVVDDVWAAVGSDNFSRRSWTHDSELTAAVLDGDRDPRTPTDPGGRGDGARRFARQLRLELLREHLDRAPGDDADLLDPDAAAEAVRRSSAALDAWHRDGRHGPRPPGRLRPHTVVDPPVWQRWLAAPVYRTVFDPDGRPPRMKLRRTL